MGQPGSALSVPSVSVFLVSENRLLRETLVRLLENRAGVSVVGASRYDEATGEHITASSCGVLLLDCPTASFFKKMTETLSKNSRQINIVLFGMDDAPESFLTAVGMGAHGYVLKDAPATEIIAAVRGVAQGEALCPPKLCLTLFQLVQREFRQKSQMAEHNAFLKFGLTYRQRQLVTLVARGLTTKEIAANLNLSQFTVKNHIHRIMKQMDVQSRFEAVDMIRASGYLPDA